MTTWICRYHLLTMREPGLCLCFDGPGKWARKHRLVRANDKETIEDLEIRLSVAETRLAKLEGRKP